MGIAQEIYGIKLTQNQVVSYSGSLFLNGVNIEYTITNDYFNDGAPDTGHLEFRSRSHKKENEISETGYRSHFFGYVTEESNNQIINDHENLVLDVVRYLVKDCNGKKVKELFIGEGKEKEIYIQASMFQ